MNFNFLDRFSKNTQISNFRKIYSVGSELFHANGQTDMMKLIVNCCNFAKVSKNGPLGMENDCSHFCTFQYQFIIMPPKSVACVVDDITSIPGLSMT